MQALTVSLSQCKVNDPHLHVDLQCTDAIGTHSNACGHWTALQITGTMRDVLPAAATHSGKMLFACKTHCPRVSFSDLPTGWEEGYTFEGARCFIKWVGGSSPGGRRIFCSLLLVWQQQWFQIAAPSHIHTHTHTIAFPEMFLLAHWRHTQVVRALSLPV